MSAAGEAKRAAHGGRAMSEEGAALVVVALSGGPAGLYGVQAAIAALHDEAPDVASTDTDIGDMSDVLDDESPEDEESDELERVTDDEPNPADVVEAAEDEEMPAEELIAADERDMHDLELAGPSAAGRAAHERTDASAERVMNGRRTGRGRDEGDDLIRETNEAGAGSADETGGRSDVGPAGRPPANPTPARDRNNDPVIDRSLPIPDYPDLTVPQVIDRLGDLSDEEVRAVREYERTHRHRKTLLDRLDRHLSGTGRRQTARSGK